MIAFQIVGWLAICALLVLLNWEVLTLKDECERILKDFERATHKLSLMRTERNEWRGYASQLARVLDEMIRDDALDAAFKEAERLRDHHPLARAFPADPRRRVLRVD